MRDILPAVVLLSLAVGPLGCEREAEPNSPPPKAREAPNPAASDGPAGQIDTSEFGGVAAWTIGTRLGVVARGLSDNQLFLEVTENELEEGQNLPTGVVLSSDGSTAAWVREDDVGLKQLAGQVVIGELADLHPRRVPADYADSPDRRISRDPSLNRDGSQVAYTEARGVPGEDGRLTDIEPGNIALWRIQGRPTLLTDDPAEDYAPVLTDDADEVIFVSERSGAADFYAMKTADGPDTRPRRLTWDNHPDIDGPPRFEEDIDHWAVSGDGAYLGFIAPVDGGRAAFVMETDTGDITRLGDGRDAKHIDIARDASTIVFIDGTTPGVGPPNTLYRANPATGEVVAVVSHDTIGDQDFINAAISADGTAILAAQSNHNQGADLPGDNLVVMHIDGSNQTLVASGDQKNYANSSATTHIVFQ